MAIAAFYSFASCPTRIELVLEGRSTIETPTRLSWSSGGVASRRDLRLRRSSYLLSDGDLRITHQKLARPRYLDILTVGVEFMRKEAYPKSMFSRFVDNKIPARNPPLSVTSRNSDAGRRRHLCLVSDLSYEESPTAECPCGRRLERDLA